MVIEASPRVSTADLQAMGSPAALPYTGREQLVLCPCSWEVPGHCFPCLGLIWTDWKIFILLLQSKSIPTL